ncbi:hypothetical protein GSY69_08590 [Brevibacterium sp. 5221]|uniref:Uncharacterized protein n=1 Tax=Brevibacterium rongguiense TaxID=2695267 RepID=A0A6N9H7G6_9MICO|nr:MULTISPECIES: hypothetical protein [Brevibacterium]MYM20018.1 hypothetical protein [Brevibacterium rongguiense]WAL40267.1 hypothetical protein BRM1_13765 [Brevibacterium sp. BRM-1]
MTAPAPPSGSHSDEAAAAAAAARRNRAGSVFFLLIAAAMLVSLLPLPLKLAAAAFAVAAVVFGIRYMVAGARAGRGGRWLLMGVLGLLACGYLLLGTAGTAILWPVQSQYEECSRAALTQRAGIDCSVSYEADVKSWFERLTGQPYPG